MHSRGKCDSRVLFPPEIFTPTLGRRRIEKACPSTGLRFELQYSADAKSAGFGGEAPNPGRGPMELSTFEGRQCGSVTGQRCIESRLREKNTGRGAIGKPRGQSSDQGRGTGCGPL